jgi:hypothetical protein
MSNFAALIDVLSVAGSRLSDGTANVSGKVWFYQPGTNNPVNAYSDAAATTIITQPVTLTSGGLVNRSDFPEGIYVIQPVRLYVEDVNGNAVVDTTYIPATAGDVGVSNTGFTDSTLDDVLSKAYASVGGQDWQYKESAGATERTLKAKLAEGGISVKDFGAVGDGIAIDTTAFQSALNRAKALSCNVIVPAGTYKTDQAETLTSATGVQIIGAGHGATIITPTHATANAFTFTSCTGCGIHGLSINHTSGSTGAAVAASASLNFSASDLSIPANASFVGFAYGMDFSGNGTIDLLANCYQINGSTRAVRIAYVGTSQAQIISGNQFGASAAAPVPCPSALEFAGATGTYFLTGNNIVGATNDVLFSGAMTSAVFVGNSIPVVLGSTQFSGATAALFPQLANGVYGYTEDVASGGTFTPNLLKGNHIRMRLTSTGVAYTVAAATPAPAAGQYGVWFILDIFNNAAGAVTAGSGLAAAYHATAPSLVDTEHTSYIFFWDASASVWRQLSRSVTT